MLLHMTEHRHHGVGDLASRRARIDLLNTRPDAPHRRSFTISCDDCAQQCTAACHDCVVSHVLREADEHQPTAEVNGLVLDVEEARVVRLMARAGLVPDLKYLAGGAVGG